MRIAIFIYDGMTALDAVGPYDILNRLPGAEVLFVGDGHGPKRAQGGLALVADRDYRAVDRATVLLLPGGGAGVGQQTGNEALLEWIRSMHERTTWTTSVCTGSLILGAAGLLEGVDATTHWRARDYIGNYGARYVDPEHRVAGGR